jgi:hypothetical protein
VLAVAATVLAILGAVSVAAWWASLNNTVTGRVKKLYKKQQQEVNTQVDKMLVSQRDSSDKRIGKLLAEQQEKADKQLAAFETSLDVIRKDLRSVQSYTEQVRSAARRAVESYAQQEALLKRTDDKAMEALMQLQSQVAEANRKDAELTRVDKEYRDHLDVFERMLKRVGREAVGKDNEQLYKALREYLLTKLEEDVQKSASEQAK